MLPFISQHPWVSRDVKGKALLPGAFHSRIPYSWSFSFPCLLPSLYQLGLLPTSHPHPCESFPGYQMISVRVSLTSPFFLCVMPFSTQGDLLLLPQLSKHSFPLLSMYPSSDGPYSDPDWLPWFHRSSSLLNSALSFTFLSELPKIPCLSSLQVSTVGR